MRKTILRVGALAFLPALLVAQFGFSVVSDPTQESHSWQQMLDDVKMINQAIQTYNRVTMTSAQVIYGVSMGSDSISRLLSLKLEEAPVAGDR